MHQNICLGSNGIDPVCSLRKIPMRLRGTNFCTSSAHFCTDFRNATKQSQMHRNSMKCTKTSFYGPMGWIGSLCCEKFRRDFVARTFALVRPIFVPIFVTQPNSPKCTQIVPNAQKHHFTVQWGGSGAFVVKNSNATSWHELLH